MEAIVRSTALVSILFLSFSMLFAAPVATVPTNIDGVEIDVTAVERRNNVLTVKWTVRNTSAERQEVAFALVQNNPTTYIVDEESGTKYFVLTDKEGKVLATEHTWVKSGSYGIGETVEPGKSMRFWAKFPAPPPAVKSINILFTDAAEPLELPPLPEVPPTDPLPARVREIHKDCLKKLEARFGPDYWVYRD